MNETQDQSMNSQLQECRPPIIRMPNGEDVFQELWLRCKRSNRDWSVPQHGFIRQVAKNICIDMRRRRTKYESHINSYGDANKEEVDEKLPLAAICEHERFEQVRKYIDSLPEPYCSTLAAHYFAGQQVSEIASQQDRSPNAIKSRLHRARRMLKDNPTMRGLAIA